jgi:hypothetical protein
MLLLLSISYEKLSVVLIFFKNETTKPLRYLRGFFYDYDYG